MNIKAAATASHYDPLDHARDLLDRSEHAPTLDALARRVGLSPAWLQRSFRRRFGVSPAEYARARRFDELKQALRSGSDVTDAVYAAGFGSGSRVYEHSDRRLGMPPARYRDGGAGIAIRYTTVASPLGRVLVAATTRGLCAVTLGDDDARLVDALREEFPNASLTRVDAGRDEGLAPVVARGARQFNGRPGGAATQALPPLEERLPDLPAGERSGERFERHWRHRGELPRPTPAAYRRRRRGSRSPPVAT